LLTEHVTLDLEGIDRLYLNRYQPRLQTGGAVATFFKAHRGAKVAATVLLAPISRDLTQGQVPGLLWWVTRRQVGRRTDDGHARVRTDRDRHHVLVHQLASAHPASERSATTSVKPESMMTLTWMPG
jgi:hypothetical protein